MLRKLITYIIVIILLIGNSIVVYAQKTQHSKEVSKNEFVGTISRVGHLLLGKGQFRFTVNLKEFPDEDFFSNDEDAIKWGLLLAQGGKKMANLETEGWKVKLVTREVSGEKWVISFERLNGNVEQNSENQEWELTIRENSIGAYAKFVEKFPNTNHKAEIKKRVDSLIVDRVSKEIKQRNAEVSKRGMDGTSIVPIGGWVGVGAIFNILGGELNLLDQFIIITDPTDPFSFTGDIDTYPRFKMATARVLKGRGIVIQYRSDKTYIYVFDVDVSSVVPKWKDWTK